ncbi:hypothetical protein LOK49_LG01G02423 [Camellia lanceoleosa]|uniref:Uncharacterized protein n=1 Tax=Camellia lanceoleosa TaxID=1840588 RepID=A0ACC0IWU9_9ERIC|nr:hypothetical protein LOK49_LG01G02423 [Camellia lanceoleosa]
MKGQSMGNSKKKVILGKVQIGTSEKRREAQSGGQLTRPEGWVLPSSSPSNPNLQPTTTPHPFSLLIFFDASQLHDKQELHLKSLLSSAIVDLKKKLQKI